MKRADLILLLATLAIAGAIALALRASSPAGAYAVVYVDGVESARYPLDKDAEETLQGFDGGFNALVVQDGEAYIRDADCPDRICVREGRIGKNGQSVICLPHRIVVTVEGGAEDDVDAVAR